MAQKRSSNRKIKRRKTRRSQKKGVNLAKITLGLFILIVLGYAALAIWEGKLVIDEVSEFEFFEEDDAALDSEQQQPDNLDLDNQTKVVDPTEDLLESSKDFDPSSFDLYFTKAFDFGWPKYSTNEAIIERPYYTARYDSKHKQSKWVAYTLHKDSLSQRALDIKGEFKKDPRVRTAAVSPDAYRGSGYILGQIAPRADFQYDEFAITQSYYMVNVSPQKPEFHEGLWLDLARKTRQWAKENEQIFIVAGPLLTDDLRSWSDEKISLPLSFYKIILDIQNPEIKAIAYLIPNEASDLPLNNYEISIDRLEELTGLDFFPNLPDELAEYLESGSSAPMWRD